MYRNQNCHRCPLHKSTTNVCIPGDGNRAADIMLVGEAPGADEERQGIPFVGAAGKKLNDILRSVGVKREELFVTNLVRCRPPGNRTPAVEEQRQCSDYLLQEISAVNPKVILALGVSTMKFLTGVGKVGDARGRFLPAAKGLRISTAKILGTYHPAAILHKGEDRAMQEAIAQDLALAVRTAHPERQREHRRALFFPPWDDDQAITALASLRSCKVLAVDCEWTGDVGEGMKWPWSKDSELFSISVSGMVGQTVYSVGLAWPPTNTVLIALKDLLGNVPSVYHNAMADLLWTHHVGLPVRLAGDTMLLAHLVDEGRSLKLEQLATTVAGVQAGWKQAPVHRKPTTRQDWERLLRYNTDDTFATLLLAQALHKQLEERPSEERAGLLRVYKYLLLPALPTFVQIAYSGTPVNRDKIVQGIRTAHATMLHHAHELAQLSGTTPTEALKLATSPMQSLDTLRKAGLNINSTSKDTLAEYEEHPLVRHVQGIRHQKKLIGTYYEPWRDLVDEQEDGSLHTIYRLTGARTGRTSAEIERGGSLQLAPRDDVTRGMFEVQQGYKLIIADYSQIELRIAAWFANERRMLQLYNESSDADLHIATAAYLIMYGREHLAAAQFWLKRHEYAHLVSKSERQRAKGANFGLVYGMQPQSLVTYARNNYGVVMTLQEAEQVHAGYFSLYPDLLVWHERCDREFHNKGYTTTPFGRYRRNVEDARKAINTPVQSTASDLTMLSLHTISVRLTRAKVPAHIVGFIHDSVLVSARDDVVEDVVRIVKGTMESPDLAPFGIDRLPVRLLADIKVGQSWADAEHVPDEPKQITKNATNTIDKHPSPVA